jgi:NAD(P)-dependent dehydrogenase (short-subunit alcohol dehydrogenase family)
MSHFTIKDKVALVTGSNRGIGEAYVLELVKAGAKKVYAAARDLKNLESLVASNPDVIEPILLDVTNAGQIAALTKTIGSLDILINNAGIINASMFTNENALEIARIEMETNYFGPIQITQAVLSLLKSSSQAAIINLSSIAGICNFPVIGPYSATKAAMHSYTQGLRAELAGEGIQVLGVYPGPIDTRMAADWEMEKAQPKQVALKTFEALDKGEIDVMPDAFSEQMYATFLEHPHELEKVFSEMQ